MKEILDKDLFDQFELADAICIPTNCSVATRNEEVDDGKDLVMVNPMGGGCAGQAARRWPVIEEIYAQRILVAGHVPAVIGFVENDKFYDAFVSTDVFESDLTGNVCSLVAYPTMHSIMEAASLDLVVRSARLLVEMADSHGWKRVYLAAPGIGIGGLDWETQVRPALESILDDRFTVMRMSPKQGFIKFGDLN